MYKMMLDTETTNDIDCPLVYDLGFCVLDDDNNVRASYSFVNADIFCDDELMASAYFAEKVPQYWEDIKNGYRVLKSFRSIERIFKRVCKDWNIHTFVAHNARFDYRALQNTKRCPVKCSEVTKIIGFSALKTVILRSIIRTVTPPKLSIGF